MAFGHESSKPNQLHYVAALYSIRDKGGHIVYTMIGRREPKGKVHLSCYKSRFNPAP